MGKIVKTVLIIAVAVAVIVFAPQIGAVLASMAGSLGVTIAASAIASAFVSMAIGVALAATMSLFRKVPNLSNSMLDRLNTTVVPSAPRKIIFGTTAGGADSRFFETHGSKKDRYSEAVAIASHRVSAIKSFYTENDLTWNGGIVAHADGIESFRAVTEGTPSNGFALGSGAYWRSTATFDGCAYYAITWKIDSKAWPNGFPRNNRTVVDGCPVYDPRLDGTQGGSGGHRYADQSTYAFNAGGVEIGRNPALCLLTYLIGWRINGKLVWGMGIPSARIDFDSFRLYANVCEERVALQAGGTVQRYTCDGIFSTADSHETVMAAITAAMGSCKLVDVGGTYSIIGGYDDTAGPKVAFDADDLIGAGGSATPYAWLPAPPSRERFNIVRGRFADPANLYQLTDWGQGIEIEPLADGVPRTMSLDLGCVSRPETCQRIAKQFLLREALAPGQFSATFGPKAFVATVGSLVTMSLPAEGWNNKLFRVIEQTETHDMFYQMTLREESAAVYAWDREEKPLPAIVRPTGYDPNDTIIPAGLSLTSASYAGSNNYNVSEVYVSWTPETSGRVAGIQIQSRPQGSDGWTEQAALYDAAAGKFTFTSNAPGITIQVRARYQMTSAVFSDWTQGSVQTAAVIITADSLGGKSASEIITDIKAAKDAGLEAQQKVLRLASDGWLTAGKEKQDAELAYEDLKSRLKAVVDRYNGLGQPPLSPASALGDAGVSLYPEYGPANGYSTPSLGYYLTRLSPGYLDRATDTQVVATEWDTRWKTAYDKIAIAEAALLGSVSSAVNAAVDSIAVITNDGRWSPYEKRSTLIQQAAELENNYNHLIGKASGLTGSTVLDDARTDATNKRKAWTDFLQTVPTWSDPNVETVVNRAEARSKVVAYGDALNKLQDALRIYTDAKAVTALQQIDDLGNDGKIAPGEKWQYVMLWRNTVNRYQRGVDRYLELGLQSGRLASVTQKQQNAYNLLGPDGNAPGSSLGKTLGALTPQWDKGDVTTIVPNPAALKQKWEDAINAVDAFLVAMSSQPDADNTSSAIASGAADSTINNKVNASPKLSKLDGNGQATSRRQSTTFALAGAQQVYIPTNGNTNVGGTVAANVPGNPLWAYTDPGGGPTATIQVFDHKLIDDAGTLQYGGGFMFNMEQGKQYWIYSDDNYTGGNVTYYATDNAQNLASPNRRLIGGVITPRTAQAGAGGGVSGGGGGGGGIRERYYSNQEVQP